MSSVVTKSWRSSARSLLRTSLRWLPGVLITLLAIWLLARVINWPDFLASLRQMPVGLLFLTVCIYLVSMIARAVAWQFLLQRQVSVPRTVLTLNEGYLF
ncbi:MAG: hypothetical protein EHM21_09770, partial [Chloroflexi bacterium]